MASDIPVNAWGPRWRMFRRVEHPGGRGGCIQNARHVDQQSPFNGPRPVRFHGLRHGKLARSVSTGDFPEHLRLRYLCGPPAISSAWAARQKRGPLYGRRSRSGKSGPCSRQACRELNHSGPVGRVVVRAHQQWPMARRPVALCRPASEHQHLQAADPPALGARRADDGPGADDGRSHRGGAPTRPSIHGRMPRPKGSSCSRDFRRASGA